MTTCLANIWLLKPVRLVFSVDDVHSGQVFRLESELLSLLLTGALYDLVAQLGEAWRGGRGKLLGEDLTLRKDKDPVICNVCEGGQLVSQPVRYEQTRFGATESSSKQPGRLIERVVTGWPAICLVDAVRLEKAVDDGDGHFEAAQDGRYGSFRHRFFWLDFTRWRGVRRREALQSQKRGAPTGNAQGGTAPNPTQPF